MSWRAPWELSTRLFQEHPIRSSIVCTAIVGERCVVNMTAPLFTIIIATYERCDSLHRLLGSIAEHFGSSDVAHEVIVANNARDERISARVSQIVQELRQRQGDYFRQVWEPAAGKCRAQNKAIGEARGSILAFFDDDVVVAPGWLSAANEFFRDQAHDAMQGPILCPPEMVNDKELKRALHEFRTIDFVQYPPTLKELESLTGANMAIRKEVFFRIGYFNEKLGPGRSGMSEDVEFAKRLRQGGGTIGYVHQAAVYHEIDWARLTEEFFRKRHEQQGRSRLIYKKQFLVSIVPNLVRAMWTFGWYSLMGNVRKQYRAKGRYFHYRAMLLEKIGSTARCF